MRTVLGRILSVLDYDVTFFVSPKTKHCVGAGVFAMLLGIAFLYLIFILMQFLSGLALLLFAALYIYLGFRLFRG